MAPMMVAMFPLPPISATNRPPGLSARATEAATASGGDIQCSAALENTASTGSSTAKSSPLATSNRSCGYNSLARAIIASEASMPTTSAPAAAICAVSPPVPHPRSTIRSPGRGASSSTTPAPSWVMIPNDSS